MRSDAEIQIRTDRPANALMSDRERRERIVVVGGAAELFDDIRGGHNLNPEGVTSVRRADEYRARGFSNVKALAGGVEAWRSTETVPA